MDEPQRMTPAEARAAVKWQQLIAQATALVGESTEAEV